MKKTFFIGISGKRGTGKSTLAQHLVEYLQVRLPQARINKLSFATTLKKIEEAAHRDQWGVVRSLYAAIAETYAGWPLHVTSEMLAVEAQEVYKRFPRNGDAKNIRFLQYVGTDVGRNLLGADVWIHCLREEANLQQLDIAIIDDVRMPNEAEMVDIHLHLDHTLVEAKWREVCRGMGYDPDDTHASENQKFDAIILLKPYGSFEYISRALFEQCLENLSAGQQTRFETEG
jgi:hypothetical protein